MEIAKRKTGSEAIPFEQVYADCFSYIYNYVYMMLLNKHNAEDIVSEVFMKAMKHYEEFNENLSSVRTWLTNIARNTVIDFYRTNARHKTESLDDVEEPSCEDEYSLLKDDVNKKIYRLLGRPLTRYNSPRLLKA